MVHTLSTIYQRSVPLTTTILVAIALSISASTDMSYADISHLHPPPPQQLKEGVSPHAIQCNEPTDLYLINSETPVCLTHSSYEALLNHGLNLTFPSLREMIISIEDAGPEEILQIVERVKRMYDFDPDSVFEEIDALSDLAVTHYPFVLDLETKTVAAHGALPSRVGVTSFILVGQEFATNPAHEIIERLETTEGTWEDYVFLNTVTGEDQLKRSWLTLHDGYIFGAGFYYPLDEKMIEGIQNSIDLIESEGEGAFEIITTEKDRGKYASVFDPEEMLELANSRQPHRVGGSIPPIPIPWGDFAEILRTTKDPIWAYIAIVNPVTGEPAQVAGLFDNYDKYLLVNGYTYPAESKVQRIVAYVLQQYETNREDSFAQLTRQSLDPLYPFVIDLETQTYVMHGGDPVKVGERSTLFIEDRTERPFDEIIDELMTNNGTWVKYRYAYPGTDYVEEKNSWLVLRDGFIFGSGFYQSAFIAHPDAILTEPPSPSVSDIQDGPLIYSKDTVIDDPITSSDYAPTRVWADFGVVHLPDITQERRSHSGEFDMVHGNALHGAFIPHLAPFILEEVSPTLNDPSILFRYVTLLLNGAFDAVAPYHETAVGVSSRISHLPVSESKTNENPNIAVMYAEYRMMLEFAPHRTDYWREMMVTHGLDPDDESGLDLDCSVVQNITSAASIGNFAAKCILDAHRNDGYNQFGTETDGVAFGDTTGYVSVNTHNSLNDPSRWQPLVARNLQGDIVPQKFATPQYANVEPYSDFDPRSIRVPPPVSSNPVNEVAYLAQTDAVIEASHNITDEQKMLIEFFDNKLRGSIFRPVLSNYHDTVDFVQWDFLVNMANYDTGIVVWQEKARYDAVRPASTIPYLYGHELIKARGPPGGDPVEIPASEWTPYVNTANHPEYPSATAALCATDAVVWRFFSGTDEIGKYVNMEEDLVGGYAGIRPAGSSFWERGHTPVEDTYLGFDTWTEYAEKCGASRVWAGVHFWPSVQVVDEIGETVGTAAFKYWESLMLGEAPLRLEFELQDPDPALKDPFWTGR